ncbi:MAG: electron transfer flavoprotein subunit alpha/FixB family protein [Promethearchaeota archaeon]
MARIEINQSKIENPVEVIEVCPFNAMEMEGDSLVINAACKMCKICTKKYPEIFVLIEEAVEEIDKNSWRGITVYVEHLGDGIHPVTFELLGKARELAAKIDHPVYCLYIGHNIKENAEALLQKGANEVFMYEHPGLEHFRVEPYTAVFEDFIKNVRPSSILVGGTTIGRSLAPRVAARFHTGLTADCTVLDMQDNTDLDQIRPAFGGNIMAHIRTPNHRPQFATVRYKIFDEIEACDIPAGAIIHRCHVDEAFLQSGIRVLEVKPKERVKTIEDADAIVVAGRGIKKKEDLTMIQELADVLGAEMATTRPLIEAGWADPSKQIGLSGRTVKPSIIITCGVSGSIQFRAGMSGSELIIAINTNVDAPIFKIAHYAIVGDLYKIVPNVLEKIKNY